jgi:anti-sigma factor RsiW
MIGPDDGKRWEELNALVDGELPSSRLADVATWIATDRDAANAFVAVATIKATTAGVATPKRKRRAYGRLAAMALLSAGLGAAVFFAVTRSDKRATEVASISPRALGLPDDVTIGGIRLPNLEAGGLRLDRTGIVQQGSNSRLEASYIGERGCYLRLVVVRAEDEHRLQPGAAQASQWIAGGFLYSLTGERMDPKRFAMVVRIAQADSLATAATRLAAMPSDIKNRPCLG